MEDYRSWEAWSQIVPVDTFSYEEAAHACKMTLYARMRVHGAIATSDFVQDTFVMDGVLNHRVEIMVEKYKP